MGTRTEYEPGTFSYAELSTSDQEGAKSFYGRLFGWDYEDVPLPEEAGGGVYTLCKVEGDTAAAIFGSDGPLPPHWNNYVTVESAADAQAKASELGGDVMMEVMDVMGLGRMAALADPTGGAFMVWEPHGNIGAERVNEPGCLTWNELHTPDPDTALEFYRGLFGWSTEDMNTGGGPRYVVVRVGDRSNGGVMNTQEGEPPNWVPYFVVEDRDAAAEAAGEQGGTELMRMEMPMGRIAFLQDPAGAVFAVWEGDTDD
jgi:uncharacterized protein